MQIYDITLPISPEMPVWPGDPKIILERVSKIEDGATANVSRISMSVHSGTHLDAPYHFLGGDTPTVDQLPLDRLVGRAYVLEIPDNTLLITATILKTHKIPPRTKRLLLKTSNSRIWENQVKEFVTGFVALTPDAAEFLVSRGIQLIGIDYLSIAPFKQGTPVHKILLSTGTIIVEGINLSRVPQGKYHLICLPLKLVGSDGSPARVILVSD
jgi:arylformamidase